MADINPRLCPTCGAKTHPFPFIHTTMNSLSEAVCDGEGSFKLVEHWHCEKCKTKWLVKFAPIHTESHYPETDMRAIICKPESITVVE